ncbi:MAG TPA: hypothetical protein PLC80_14595 [Draconibacterium sp.]|nr:hypothetical protein [Draconibacterium sp.]
MKKLIAIILFGMFIFPLVLQGQVLSDQQKDLYQKKVYKFKKMKSTGVAVTFGGAILTAGGIAMMIKGADEYVNNDSYSSTDLYPTSFYVGYIGAILGGAATTGGIVMWSIGGSKARSYSKRLNSLSLNLNPAPKQMISLSYRF